MTNSEKFSKGIVVYKNSENNYVLELWGGSTKHPDSIFHMEDFKMPSWVDPNDEKIVKAQVFQWLLECASKLNFPFHAEILARYALENWCVWRN